MANTHDYALTTLQARTAAYLINNDMTPITDRQAIETAAHSIIDKLVNDFPEYFPADVFPALFAFVLSNLGKKAVRTFQLSAIEYIQLFAQVKQENTILRNDFGAFGDLFELLVRLALVKNVNLINWRMLTVKAINESDIVSKKFGSIEVGTNGKTWTNATLYDYMEGDFTAVIYGVFSEEDKKDVFDLCTVGKITDAIEYVTNYAVLWTDKYQYLKDMNELTRGKGLTVKSGNVQTVYNEGKRAAFIDAIESGKFTSLWDTLQS